MSKSDFLENELLDHRYGGSDYVRPATVYMRLHTADPGETGSGAEVSTGVWTNYAAVAITNNATNFPAAAAGSKSNGTLIDFGTATISGAAPDVTHASIWDAATGGNLMDYGALASPKTINDGDPVSVPIGDLVITET